MAIGPLPRRSGRKAGSDVKRVTFVLPAVLDENLEKFAIFEGTRKMHLATEALKEYLIKRGVIEPLRPLVAPWRVPSRSVNRSADAAPIKLRASK